MVRVLLVSAGLNKLDSSFDFTSCKALTIGNPSRSDHSVQNIEVLPQGVLALILKPRHGLSGKDVAHTLVASSHLSTAKASFMSGTLFYYAFAKPYLNMQAGDNSIRVAQSFYKCGRLSPNGKRALARFLRVSLMEEEEYTDSILITACASQVKTMLESQIIPGISALPERFKIQFVYQQMSHRDTFERLMSLFQFVSPSVQKTLEYEQICNQVNEALSRESMVRRLEELVSKESRVVVGGCLIASRVIYLASYRSNVLSEFDIQFATRIMHFLPALIMAEARFAPAIKEYRALSAAFHSATLTPQRIDVFVAQGLLLNLELPIEGMEPSFILPYFRYPSSQWSVLKAFLAAGFNVDRPNPHRLSNHALDMRMLGDGERKVLWWFAQGSDINRRHHYHGHTFLTAVMESGPIWTEHDRFYHVLVEHGAEVQGALLGLTRVADLAKVRYFVEHGRPGLNDTSSPTQGGPLIFGLIERMVDLSVLEYLVLESGLRLDESVLAFAQKVAQESDPTSKRGRQARLLVAWVSSHLNSFS